MSSMMTELMYSSFRTFWKSSEAVFSSEAVTLTLMNLGSGWYGASVI